MYKSSWCHIGDSYALVPWMYIYIYMNIFQVMGGDPLLKLLAVDWFTVDRSIDQIALHPKCLVQVDLLISFIVLTYFQVIHMVKLKF